MDDLPLAGFEVDMLQVGEEVRRRDSPGEDDATAAATAFCRSSHSANVARATSRKSNRFALSGTLANGETIEVIMKQ